MGRVGSHELAEQKPDEARAKTGAPVQQPTAEIGRLSRTKSLLRSTYSACIAHDQLTNAAALSFFFLLSLSPLMIFLVSLIGVIPVPDLDRHVLKTVSEIVPSDAMKIVGRLLTSVFESSRSLLSLGIIGAIWAASTGFNATIMSLNRAYDVKEARSLWKRQLVSIGLTVAVGLLMIATLFLLFLGSEFGSWLARQAGLELALATVWPYVRWLVVVGFTILSVELLYSLGPNVKQRFFSQIPGAVLAVVLWLASSFSLSLYLRNFKHFTAIYGTLGAMIALMGWLYFSSLAILIGAELNAQLSQGER